MQAHGTRMAGLAAYGPLVSLLESTLVHRQQHNLESVKLLKNSGSHDPELYGAVTAQAVAYPETESQRARAFCMAITAEPPHSTGGPTSWSAAVDELCAGAAEGDSEDASGKRLMFLAAGNFDQALEAPEDFVYPDSLHNAPVQEPAQAWNAISVGAITHYEHINESDDEARTSQPIAAPGTLSPTSRTSRDWERKWPYKPDIVMEGGNLARTATNDIIALDSLRPLTTNENWRHQPFRTLADTSAATALAARLGAMLINQYPNLWPESIRGLVVHSARWNPRMLAGLDPHARIPKDRVRELLRVYGWGEPDIPRALLSARNKTTIITQNILQPFHLAEKFDINGKKTKSIATRDWHVHELPWWPRDLLLNAGETQVSFRVTLSYFIEPNPGSRAVPGAHPTQNRYRYASCGLRFEVKPTYEEDTVFRAKLNAAIQLDDEGEDDEDEISDASGTDNRWALGTRGRRIGGSLHQDVWRGSAADLATMDRIAVIPVKGWWATRKFPPGHERHDCHNRPIRYALVMSIETEADVPIYNFIETSLSAAVDNRIDVVVSGT
ncbi:S8 family peptidase [Prosthecobacter sp.]|uniref:S8 family peptidase n=1 Tax=Prosthecobacter sp. TaxID=1965333 RepID=UPI002ABCC230|nr:S8 family peptidase [Prosthecobacter sp.]MDZ4401446.1 S8 family peptidase [Prosthecobacter sp.]